MAQTVIVITNANVQFADDATGIATAPDFQCQVISAAINANPNLQTVPATFCSGETQVPGQTGFELALTWLQDWTATAGLSEFAWDNDAAEKYFSISLDDAVGSPIATGVCRVVAGAFGGDAGTPLQATATWPIIGKPDIGVSTVAATFEAAREAAEEKVSA